MVDHPAKVVQPGVFVARRPITFAGQLDVTLVDPRLGMCPTNHRFKSQIVITFKSGRPVGDRRQSGDVVRQTCRVVVGQHPAVRVRDARQTAVVGSPRRGKAVPVLHARRRARVHRPACRLPLLGHLPEAVVRPLDLVDDRAAGDRVVARGQVGIPLAIIGRLHPANRAIDACAQRGHRVAHHASHRVVRVRVHRANAIGPREHLAKLVVRQALLVRRTRRAGRRIGITSLLQHVVADDRARDPVDPLRFLVPAPRQIGTKCCFVSARVVSVFDRLVVGVRDDPVNVVVDRFRHPPHVVEIGFPNDAPRIGGRFQPSCGVVSERGHQHRVAAGRHRRGTRVGRPAVGPDIDGVCRSIGLVVISRRVAHPCLDARRRRAQRPGAGLDVESIPVGDQQGPAADVISRVGLVQNGIAGHGQGIRIVRVTPAVGQEIRHRPHQTVERGLGDQSARSRSLHDFLPGIKPGVCRECVRRDRSGRGIDRKNILLILPGLLVVGKRRFGPKQAGTRPVGNAVSVRVGYDANAVAVISFLGQNLAEVVELDVTDRPVHRGRLAGLNAIL